MDESIDPTLNERLASLEAQVGDLQKQLVDLKQQMLYGPPRAASVQPGTIPEGTVPPPLAEQTASAQPEAAPEVAMPPPSMSRPPPVEEKRTGPSGRSTSRRSSKRSSRRASRSQAARVQAALKSEDWLSRLGIALLLIGLAFLFKFGIDRVWVTPVVRVLFGVVLGGFLLGAGLKLRPKRLALGRVLLGGSIATFYVTIFAAYQFYSLVAYPVAFGAMIVVTLLCFSLAVQQHDAVLALIATVGGLGTPFLLYTGEGNVPGLVLYTCLVLACAGAVYLYRGWRTLLWIAAAGGWLVVLVPWFELAFESGSEFADLFAVQAGLGFCLLAFGVMPVMRETWRQRHPDRWPVPPLTMSKKDDVLDRPALTFSVIAPLLTLGLSVSLWDFEDYVWGVIGIGMAGIYAGAYMVLRRKDLSRLASAHAVAAALLLVAGWSALVDEEWMWYLLLALEAAGLHVLARQLPDRALRFLGHVGFFIVAMALTARLLDLDGETPVLVNGEALVDLVVVALLFGAAWTLRSGRLAAAYRLVAYVGLLGWFWRDLVVLPNGQAYVSIAWGLCALTLLALGWRSDIDWVRNTGLATLLVVIAKLFLVDLAKLEAVWRILLFLGFGGLLLLLSYFFPKLWKGEPEPDEAEAPSSG